MFALESFQTTNINLESVLLTL